MAFSSKARKRSLIFEILLNSGSWRIFVFPSMKTSVSSIDEKRFFSEFERLFEQTVIGTLFHPHLLYEFLPHLRKGEASKKAIQIVREMVQFGLREIFLHLNNPVINQAGCADQDRQDEMSPQFNKLCMLKDDPNSSGVPKQFPNNEKTTKEFGRSLEIDRLLRFDNSNI